MTGPVRTALGVALTLLVAAAGGWVGVRYGLREAHAEQGLDEILHHQLALTADQELRIATLESDFAARRQAFEAAMRAANRDLASAIVAEHRYGPRTEGAINQFHDAMKGLQAQTVMHILAMRAVLSAEQAQRFDQTVSQVLNSDPP